MQTEEAVSKIRAQSPDAFLHRARKRGWICPVCGNGEGKDGDGIVMNKKTSGSYKCFRCGFSGDILDLIGRTFGLSEFKEQLSKARELYGITLDACAGSSARTHTRGLDTVISVEATAEAELSEYYARCQAAVGNTAYFAGRGISRSLIDRFRIGYDPEFSDGGRLKRPFPAVIFPTSSQSFEARNINTAAGGAGFRYYKHGAAVLFNRDVLAQEKEKPVFVVEGIIDALSVMEAGGQAVGLSSADNYRLLLAELDRIVPAKPLVLCFDADETGARFETKLAEELQKRQIPFLRATNEIVGACHDPNDRLIKDAAGMKAAVAAVCEKAAGLSDPAEEAREEYLKTSAGRSVAGFLEAVRANAGRPRLSTGFGSIDRALDGGLYAGLYFIGAISSLGKTTLLLQMADSLAKQGRDVLFFSLEQSKYDLMSKSISRETFLYCRMNGLPPENAKSNLAVTDGRRWADFCEIEYAVMRGAFKSYESFARHVFIYEGIGNISVEEIREKVKNHISLTGNKCPVVFIDYLQILQAARGDERATDKQVVDHNVTALKQLSRDFGIPVCAVSSLNRENYRNKISMAAFKESGAIEYGSDVLIGLQLTGAGEDHFDADKAKSKDPREISFCILKNRNGKIFPYGIPLLYYPAFNCFIEENDTGEFGSVVILSKEQEDNLPFG